MSARRRSASATSSTRPVTGSTCRRSRLSPPTPNLLVDGTQSVGAIDVDVSKTPVDLLVASSHKWLCAPHGAAICYLGPRLDDLRPPFVGWRGLGDANDFDGRALQLAAGARRVELGTIAYGAGIALEAAIGYLRRLTIQDVETRNLALAKRLAYGLAELGAIVVTPPLRSARAGILAARVPGYDSVALVERLKAQRVFASARQGLIRFAVHVFNDAADVENALAALERAIDGDPVT